ncbi:MAG: alpha-hydroxy-acid oxidizing protein [Chloroflexi bacterium]|nr:alpha-hydroxy-acid oxidizing protein [Chloroflexota bacterium]
MASAQNLLQLEALAREKLPPQVFDFIAGAAEDEITLARNRDAWQAIQILPRVLVDVSTIDTSVTVLGQTMPSPVVLAPIAFQRLAHDDGELATARAAAAQGTTMTLSTMASCTIEDVAAAADGPKWFQLYCYTDKAVTERLVKRAEAAGYSALCLTVDVPRLGRRERDFVHNLGFPDDITPVNFEGEVDITEIPLGQRGSALSAYAASLLDDSLTWDDVDWLRSLTSMPVILKGILAPADAVLAADHGAAAVIVSNHGGRQLDGTPAGVEVLPDVVAAVGDRLEVLVDGGVRRGTDVLKALALGARAVLIGRPYIWGLALDGEDGVAHVLEMLQTEFELAMALSGATSVAQINRALVR